MFIVNLDTPNPRFGNILLRQFGSVNGELAAAMQYSIQGLKCEDQAHKAMLRDIGTEELSHLEVIGTMVRMYLKPMEIVRIAIVGRDGISLFNSMGNPWTADYLKISGELDLDLCSNIAAEPRAKITYERLIQFTDDPGTIQALQYLMTREVTHMKAFMVALESMSKDPLAVGQLSSIEELVELYFNDFTGTGDHGEKDIQRPWNTEPVLTLTDNPAIGQLIHNKQGLSRKS